MYPLIHLSGGECGDALRGDRQPRSDGLLDAVDERTQRLLERPARARRSRLIPRVLVAADLVALALAYLVATLLSGSDGALGSTRELVLFGASLPCWVLVAELQGLYKHDEERADHTTTDDVVGVFHLVTTGAWLLLVASRLVGGHGPAILNLTVFWLVAICLLPLARTLSRWACRRSRAYIQNTVIVGAGDVGQLICRKLLMHPEYGANVVGFVDRSPRMRRADLPEHLSVLGEPGRLPEIIERLQVERVVIAFSRQSTSELLDLLRRLRPLGVQVDLVPWLFELIGTCVSVHSVEGLTLLGLPRARRSPVARMLKRAIDVGVSSAALLILGPLMAGIGWLIRRDSPGPALYRQTRVGAAMREFEVLKFRTMREDTDPAAHRAYVRDSMAMSTEAGANGLFKLERAEAVTRIGRWLRKSSLDELPQLINVLRGEMSLVGPRPCIPYELDGMAPHHFDRFAVPQGITGLWQVTARANASYREAIELDVAYVRVWSLWLDLRLLLRTPLAVLRQRGATA
jgi:exopolysaccharide biosynthesis polyprenyl glycosylphosphotransferase